MHVEVFTVNPFQQNCIVCHDEGEAVLIDPGTSTSTEREAVLDYIEGNSLVLRHLLLTHGHLDHVIDCRYFSQRYGMSFQIHRDDLPLIEHIEEQEMMVGMKIDTPPRPTRFLEEGQQITFGTAVWDVLHTPGHSPGSVTFVDRANRFAVAGDVLFRGSIGRTDLWRGSLPTLMDSIFRQLVPLGEDFCVYCGHGPSTTIGEEVRSNPFLVHGLGQE